MDSWAERFGWYQGGRKENKLAPQKVGGGQFAENSKIEDVTKTTEQETVWESVKKELGKVSKNQGRNAGGTNADKKEDPKLFAIYWGGLGHEVNCESKEDKKS